MPDNHNLKIDITRSTETSNSFRAQSVRSDYDYPHQKVQEHFTGEISIPQHWNIGVIVGSSGSGKTTIANQLFANAQIKLPEFNGKSVIDDMPKDSSINEIEQMFNHLGFSSIPSWLKPYRVLSNGEQMRTQLAYTILSSEGGPVIFDEFTSVVDREVAENLSMSLAKTVRAENMQFIAVSCHNDICDWLEPDWVYDTDSQSMIDPKRSSVRPEHSQSNGADATHGETLAAITI